MPYIAKHLISKCSRCGACYELVACPGEKDKICIGCGACTLACPNQAIKLIEQAREGSVQIEVDGKKVVVSELISVAEALQEIGYEYDILPEKGKLFAPCRVGGCSSCAVEIDNKMQSSCIFPVYEGMKVSTKPSNAYTPKRLVEGFAGHSVGGVGTPFRVRKTPKDVVEIVCFTAGCNFRCPQCQNWYIAFKGNGEFLSPAQAALKMKMAADLHTGVERMTVSGGEATLNRPWLIQFIIELKKLFPGENAHFHVDTNGSLLSKDYIDELIEVGMTDIGIDLKSLYTDTFMKITGIKQRQHADRYKAVAWNAFKYLKEKYSSAVFVGVGIPYNKDFVSMEEIREIGKRIYNIDKYCQVSVNDYQPAFRSSISKTTSKEMKDVFNILKSTGLETVICQSRDGYIGP